MDSIQIKDKQFTVSIKEQDIQKEVDTYVSQVKSSLQSAMEAQRKHLTELMSKYQVSSNAQLQQMITKANDEVESLNQFLKILIYLEQKKREYMQFLSNKKCIILRYNKRRFFGNILPKLFPGRSIRCRIL